MVWRLVVATGLIASLAVLVVSALVPVPQAVNSPVIIDEHWCDAMLDKPDRDWAEQDITNFSQNCI